MAKRKLPAGGETIGERLARLRKERGFTQADLAERLDVSQPIVSDYERGELRLHGELIVRISGILGVSADEILGLKDSKTQASRLTRKVLRRAERIETLSARDQQALLRTIDAFLRGSDG